MCAVPTRYSGASPLHPVPNPTTRSPHRPNPIGLHRVVVTEVDGLRVRVRGLEALDGTPILDVKPALPDDVAAR